MRLAIFDLDGTVLRTNSWRIYWCWVFGRRLADMPRLSAALLLRATGLMDGPGLRNAALRSLRGLDRRQVMALGQTVATERLIESIRPAARREIARCAAEGHKLVLATGAFDFIAIPLAAELGIERVISTRLGYDAAGLCRGCIEGMETRGQEKSRVLTEMFPGEDVDWQRSWMFSDDLEDMPLFSKVGNPVWVRPGDSKAKVPTGIQLADWDSQ